MCVLRENEIPLFSQRSLCLRMQISDTAGASGVAVTNSWEKIKLGGVWGGFFGVWVPVPAPWWQWRLEDGFAQCLAEADAPFCRGARAQLDVTSC